MIRNEATLIGIAIREASRAPMEEVDRAEITADQGIVGDFRGRPGPRQVTVLSTEDWNTACEVLGAQLPWTTRRSNLLVQGVKLRETADAILRIGDVVLQVTGETDPCSRMEEAAAGLYDALTPDWRGGVCCRVIQGGIISLQQAVTLEQPSA